MVAAMANAVAKTRRGRPERGDLAAVATARSGRGVDDSVVNGVGGSVGWLLLSALVREPGGGQELPNPGHGPVVGQVPEDVAEVLEGRCADEVTVDDQGVQDREAPGGVVGAGEQPVPAADRESPFILPMLANAPSSTTGGTLRSAPRSASRIVSIAAEKTSPCSTRATELARCCQLGCSTPPSARR